MTQQELPSKIYDYCPFQGGTSDTVLRVAFWCQFLYCFHLLCV